MNEPGATSETVTKQSSAVVSVLRWIAVLPGCFVAALVASIVFKVLGNIGLWLTHVNSESPLRLITEWGANVIFGGVQVYVASLIAPAYRKQTALVIVALNLIFSGVVLFLFIGPLQFLGIVGTIVTHVGAIVVMIMIFRGNIHFS